MENNFDTNPMDVSRQMSRSEKEVEAFAYLNKIVRGEISAVEAYSKVIEKFPHDAEKFELASFRQDHQRNVDELKRLLRFQGEEVSDTSGAWGSTVTTMISIVSFMGDKSAVALLIEGEEHGLNQYSDVLNFPMFMRDCGKNDSEILVRII